jgi:hypothetical protein
MNFLHYRTEQRFQRRAMWYQAYVQYTLLSTHARIDVSESIINPEKKITKKQIEELVKSFEYPPDVLECDKDDCPVCFSFLKSHLNSEEDNSLAKFPCGHIFHSSCITPWLLKNNSCPSCRFRIY